MNNNNNIFRTFLECLSFILIFKHLEIFSS